MENARLLATVRRQAWLVAVCVVVVGAVAGAYAFSRPKEYDAAATIQLGVNAAANVYLDQGASPTDPDVVAAEAQLVTAVAVQRRVAVALNQSPEQIRSNIRVVGKPGLLPGTILVIVSAPTAQRAAMMANAYASNFLAERAEAGPLPLQKAATALQARLDDLKRQLDDVTAKAAAGGPQGDAAKAQVASVAGLYQSVFVRQQDLLLRISVQGSDAVITDEALPPAGPARPKPLRNTAVGVIVGLLLGLGAALLRERIADKLGDREQIESELGLPVLAEIPVDGAAVGQAGHLAMPADASGVLAESLRTLRSSIQFLGVESPVRRIVVTSASPGEGKSYVAANLAVAFAQAGFRTTLVSSDLRRPGLDRLFPAQRDGEGLSAAIAGQVRLGGDANGSGTTPGLAHPTDLANLDFVPAGAPPPNAGELLASRRAAETFNHLAADSEINVYDSPPLLAVSDGAILATMADGVVLVAVAGRTRRNQLRRAQASLEAANARILGVVLNKAKLEGISYSYAYGPDAGRRPKRKDRAVIKDPTSV